MNSVNLIGRLCAEPELRRTNDGTPVCSYSIAVKRPMVKDATDFIECVSWKQGAEYLAQYGHKGDIVGVSGSLQAREWTDKDGNKRKAWEVVTTSVELISSKKKTEEANNTNQNNNGLQRSSYQPQQNNQQGFGGYPQGSYQAQQGFVPIDNNDQNLPF